MAAGDAVGDRVPYAFKEPAAAVQVAPTLLVLSFGIVAQVQISGPNRIFDRVRVGWAYQAGLAGVAELIFRPRAAPRTWDQQHQWATAAAAASSIRRPDTKRSSPNGAASGCGSPRAMVAAKT